MRRLIAWALIICGCIAVMWSVMVWTNGQRERAERARRLPSRPVASAPARGQTLGLLQIPRLDLSVVVVEGDDEETLKEGAGHLPETPLPWARGNSVVAGHRDTDFRPLRDIKTGDSLLFQTADTATEFVVTETKIVAPDDVSVLEPTSDSVLTLITCYPFTYIGPAPQRFIVRAERYTSE